MKSYVLTAIEGISDQSLRKVDSVMTGEKKTCDGRRINAKGIREIFQVSTLAVDIIVQSFEIIVDQRRKKCQNHHLRFKDSGSVFDFGSLKTHMTVKQTVFH